MKNFTKKLFMTACLATSLVLQGCAITPASDQGIEALTDGNVVRFTVQWDEKTDAPFVPASYNVETKYHHWVKENEQYRWTFVKAMMRRDKWGNVNRMAFIADGVPTLKAGDLVDVYLPPYKDINYAEMQVPVIMRLVCASNDSSCKNNAEKQLGGKNEVVQKGMPDMSQYTLSKVFDAEGKRIK